MQVEGSYKALCRPQVFISYVHEDLPHIHRLAQVLEAYQVKVWLDRQSLKPGYRWKRAIRDGIAHGDYFVPCFSQAYAARARTYMNEELTLAIDELRQRPADKAWFIPVRLDASEIPDRDIGGGETLRSIHCVSLYEDWTRGMTALLDVIQPGSDQFTLVALAVGPLTSRLSSGDGIWILRVSVLSPAPVLVV